jgi:hypothetical protein
MGLGTDCKVSIMFNGSWLNPEVCLFELCLRPTISVLTCPMRHREFNKADINRTIKRNHVRNIMTRHGSLVPVFIKHELVVSEYSTGSQLICSLINNAVNVHDLDISANYKEDEFKACLSIVGHWSTESFWLAITGPL